MRSLMFLAAVVVAGTWMVARHLPQGEAHAGAVVKQDVRAQEIQSISIDTPSSPRDERKLEADRRALEGALVARGFLAATVSPASVTFAKTGGAYVVFDVARGPMFRLRAVTVTGPGEVDADVVTLSVGDDAVAARIARARQTLAEAVAHRKLAVEVNVHEDRATASLDVELATR